MTQHTRSTRHTLATAAGAVLVAAVLGGGLAIWVGLIARPDTRGATLSWLAGYIAVAYVLDRITVRLRDPQDARRTLMAALLLGAGLIMTNPRQAAADFPAGRRPTADGPAHADGL